MTLEGIVQSILDAHYKDSPDTLRELMTENGDVKLEAVHLFVDEDTHNTAFYAYSENRIYFMSLEPRWYDASRWELKSVPRHPRVLIHKEKHAD